MTDNSNASPGRVATMRAGGCAAFPGRGRESLPVRRLYHPSMRSSVSIEIRQAGPHDAERLAPFAARVFHETFAHLSDKREMSVYLAQSFSTTQIEAELRDPQGVFYLAEVDHTLAGYLKLATGYVPGCVKSPRPVE